MARINFYIPKEDEPIYEKLKEYSGGSTSAVLVTLMKRYVLEREMEISDMKEIRLLVGQENFGTHESNLTGIKFTGKHLAELNVDNYQDTEKAVFNVYFTKKSKILVHCDYVYGESMDRTIKHDVYNCLNDFLTAGYPPELVGLVLKNMPEIQFEDLDV
jgi:hypothetical protein